MTGRWPWRLTAPSTSRVVVVVVGAASAAVPREGVSGFRPARWNRRVFGDSPGFRRLARPAGIPETHKPWRALWPADAPRLLARRACPRHGLPGGETTPWFGGEPRHGLARRACPRPPSFRARRPRLARAAVLPPGPVEKPRHGLPVERNHALVCGRNHAMVCLWERTTPWFAGETTPWFARGNEPRPGFGRNLAMI